MTNPRPSICIACGKTDDEVYFGGQYARCGECRWKLRVRSRAGKTHKTRPAKVKYMKTTVVKVIQCPHNEYPQDSVFAGGDFRASLKAGVWTLGMIVEINKKRYAVCGNGVVARTLKRLDYKAKLRRQWLMEV